MCLCGTMGGGEGCGKAPLVVLESTHESALEHVKLSDLRKHALDVAG